MVRWTAIGAAAGVALALVCVEAALASASEADSLLARSKAEEVAGHEQAAIRLAQAAIVSNPARTDSYTALADLYARAHDGESASFYYQEALDIDPQDSAAQRGLMLAQNADKTRAAAAAGSLDKDGSAH
jgi:tetratricopeptide (TPR) repeat protein